MQGTRKPSAGRLGAVLLVLLAMASFVAVRSTAAQNQAVTINLDELNSSGVSGTATLTDKGNGKVTVSIKVNGATGDHPAHIHKGTCDNLNPNPQYPLANIDANGVSETDVQLDQTSAVKSLSDLLAGEYAINVHKSATELGTYVTCGNIVAAAVGGGTTASGTGGTTKTPTPSTTTAPGTGVGASAGRLSNAVLLAALVALALALMSGGVVLRRRGVRS